MSPDCPRISRLCCTLLLLLAAALPLPATVSTAYNCPESPGNQDSISNGILVSSLAASNIHTVTIYYQADTSGLYGMTLEAHSGSFSGPQIGTTQSQSVSLSSTSLTPVVWSFGDAPFTSGQTIAFVHNQTAGRGAAVFNLNPSLDACPGDVETVGLSAISNGLAVPIIITENVVTVPTCTESATTLCIDDKPGDRRYAVTSTFETSQDGGQSGNGHAIQTNSLGIDQGGLFWFFNQSNPEVLIKVLNGCGVNNQRWVFFAALTNVGFGITVTDVTTGKSVSYTNTDNTTALPVQDTSAFSCP
jgi:hypothetical protein